jgi:hypothetical protein
MTHKTLEVWASTQADGSDAKRIAEIDTAKEGAYEAARTAFVTSREDAATKFVWVNEVGPDATNTLWTYP